MSRVLTNATVVTVDAGNRVLEHCDVRVSRTDIVAIGTNLVQPGDEVHDCSGTVVIPGLINVHTHAATGLFRGLADDKPKRFWSPHFQLPGQERFGIEDYSASLRAVCAESLLNGVTCIADRLGDMDLLAPVIEASGIRAVVGHTLRDNGAAADWATAERVLERYGTDPRRRVFAGIAPHALDSCSDELLRACARRAEQCDARVFIHVAQSEAEVAAVRARGHSGALACLERAGLAGPQVVAAHGIYLTDAEITRWPEASISIAHCPASNLKIEARTLAIHRLHGKAAIGLGTDWAATNNSWDLLAEARIAALVGKMLADDPTVLTAQDMLRMATIDGARVLGLERVTGSIEVGKRADLVILDAERLCMSPDNDIVSNIIYANVTRAVRDVMVDAHWRVDGGRLTDASEADLAAVHSARAAKRQWPL